MYNADTVLLVFNSDKSHRKRKSGVLVYNILAGSFLDLQEKYLAA
jgi:hypothetical protein